MLITEDGTFRIPDHKIGGLQSRRVVYFSGTPAGAVVTLQYKDELDNFVSLENGVLTIDTQNVITTGTDMTLYAQVTSANTAGVTNLSLMLRGLN